MNTLQIDDHTTSAILAAIHQYILEEDHTLAQNPTLINIKTNWQNVVSLNLGTNYHQLDLIKISPELLQTN